MHHANEEHAVAKFTPLAMKLARQFITLHHEYDDLLQSAKLGIVRANRTYRADLGATFETWTYTCIYNALRKHGVDNSGLIHIPAHVMEHNAFVQRKENCNVHHAIPVPSAVSGVKTFREGKLVESDPGAFCKGISAVEINALIESLMVSLSPEQREIILLIHLKGNTGAEVGDMRGVTRSAIQFAERIAIRKMRKRVLALKLTHGFSAI